MQPVQNNPNPFISCLSAYFSRAASSSDSRPGATDQILDFVSGLDKIDLTGITKGAGLHFVSAFTGAAGDAVLSTSGGNSLLSVDFSGHGVADFLVSTVGQAAVSDIVA